MPVHQRTGWKPKQDIGIENSLLQARTKRYSSIWEVIGNVHIVSRPDPLPLSKLQIHFWPEPEWKFPHFAGADLSPAWPGMCWALPDGPFPKKDPLGPKWTKLKEHEQSQQWERLSYKVQAQLKLGMKEDRQFFLDPCSRKRDILFLCWCLPAHHVQLHHTAATQVESQEGGKSLILCKDTQVPALATTSTHSRDLGFLISLSLSFKTKQKERDENFLGLLWGRSTAVNRKYLTKL